MIKSNINNNMDFEDSRNALFPEPNAHIQRFENRDKERKKIVFQEPYECLPSYHINNNFTKHGCDYVSKPHFHDCDCNHGDIKYGNTNSNYPSKHFFSKQDSFCKYNNNFDCNCNHDNYNLNNLCQHDDNCHNGNSSKRNGFGFDLKSFLPLLSLLNKSGGADLSQLASLLNDGNNSQNGNNSNPMNLISSVLSNKDAMNGILNLFKGGGLNLFNKRQNIKKELKTTDYEIKNYTRVE